MTDITAPSPTMPAAARFRSALIIHGRAPRPAGPMFPPQAAQVGQAGRPSLPFFFRPLSRRSGAMPEVLVHLPKSFRAIPNFFRAAVADLGPATNFSRGIPKTFRETPKTHRETPKTQRETPIFFRVGTKLIRVIPNILRVIPNILRVTPNFSRALPIFFRDAPQISANH